MENPLDVLIAGRIKSELDSLEQVVAAHPVATPRQRLITNGHVDPLWGVEKNPDVLVFSVTGNWREELAAVGERPAAQRPPLVIVGPAGEHELMRMAMQAGARDFLTHPIGSVDLLTAIDRLERDRGHGGAAVHVTAVINAKGGAGASTIAANLAHIGVRRTGRRILLMDMDLQFGSLPLHFDLGQGGGLMEALERVGSLDRVALDGYTLKHQSGLHLLAAAADQMVYPGDVDEGRLRALMELAASGYQRVVVDLARSIDPVNSVVLENADRVVIVLQQSLAHLRDAKQMIRILTSELGIPMDRIMVVVNRWQRKGAIAVEDISNGLGGRPVFQVANDFARLSESANLGVPIYDLAPKSPVAKDLSRLWDELAPETKSEPAAGARFLRWARA